jgi:polysaccharide deacetylase family protein (PEP-CTERM system associated)
LVCSRYDTFLPTEYTKRTRSDVSTSAQEEQRPEIAPMSPNSLHHALTVDLEDWFDGLPISAVKKRLCERRLWLGLNKILVILNSHKIKATFFVLGRVALGSPEILRLLVHDGHEIACHGWSHDPIYTMSPERFRCETQRSIDVIESVIGAQIQGYRAPYFSICRGNLWALDILAELGFADDSSIYPIRNWRYGIPAFSSQLCNIQTAMGNIVEIPISVRNLHRLHIPVSGGAYLRIYPLWLSIKNIRYLEDQDKPAVLYIHPWELDPDHPKIDFFWRARATHYFRLSSTEAKLSYLTKQFKFRPIRDVVMYSLAILVALPC